MLILTSCAAPLTPEFMQEEHSESLVERLEHEASQINHKGEQSALPSIEHLLTEVDSVEVETIILSAPFRTQSRTGKIVQYPCSSCHIEALADLQAKMGASAPAAHWDIAIAHADESVMSCTTCHNPENMNELHTITEQAVEFDHSYQVCAQCHSGVAEDWAGGSHGKRIGGWAPPRMVNNCTDCHNPHQPAWDIRWPAVTNDGTK